MRCKVITRILFLFIFSFAAYCMVFSQEPGNDRRRPPEPGDRRWDRIEEFKKLKMIEELNLNEDESIKFYTRYNTLTSQFKEIEKERRKAINELDKILEDPSKTSELEKKLDYIESLEQKNMSNRITFMVDLKKILSVEKVARYVLFERNFQRELQNIVKDARKPPFER